MKNYAKDHYAEKNVIVIVFRNESVEDSRAYVEPSLVNENTPVIIVGRKVLELPGTKCDLTHELGHVLLRSGEHSTGMYDLMNLGSDIGDKLPKAQIDKAKNTLINKCNLLEVN